MSKSDPNSAIFMEDSAAEVKTKIKKAFCPPEQVRPSLNRSTFALVVLNLLSCDQCWQGLKKTTEVEAICMAVRTFCVYLTCRLQ